MITAAKCDGPILEPMVYDGLRVQLEGLSGDTKPTTVKNGSGFYEINTGKYYMFDEENSTWREQ